MPFIALMTSNKGRIMRVVVGLVLMTVGLVVVKGTPGTILAIIALVPIAGGALDFCLAGVVLGYPFRGAEARKQLALEQQKP